MTTPSGHQKVVKYMTNCTFIKDQYVELTAVRNGQNTGRYKLSVMLQITDGTECYTFRDISTGSKLAVDEMTSHRFMHAWEMRSNVLNCYVHGATVS